MDQSLLESAMKRNPLAPVDPTEMSGAITIGKIVSRKSALLHLCLPFPHLVYLVSPSKCLPCQMGCRCQCSLPALFSPLRILRNPRPQDVREGMMLMSHYSLSSEQHIYPTFTTIAELHPNPYLCFLDI